KNITEENIKNTIKSALEYGYNGFKLYFMIGLPTETMEDLQGIVDIVLLIKDMAKVYSKSKRPVQITVSTSVFIPKPLTPFQWERQIDEQEMLAKQKFLIDNLHIKNVRYNWHSADSSIIEAVFSRGDRKLLDVIEQAYFLGCKFDGWSEKFDFDKWKQAFENVGVNIRDYTREWSEDEILPWDFVEHGISKKYLLNEKHKAYSEVVTKACGKNSCSGCGANKLGRCYS
ncbi:MAG: B12-binding domain-containing radical SAM protein, partial [Clostridia bacterium]|nr:B12-binding domain-containing radical SAM protein [Clostridia bacterium]